MTGDRAGDAGLVLVEIRDNHCQVRDAPTIYQQISHRGALVVNDVDLLIRKNIDSRIEDRFSSIFIRA